MARPPKDDDANAETHHSISRRWLDSYLNEWVWKWNHRDDDEAMFRQLLSRAAA